KSKNRNMFGGGCPDEQRARQSNQATHECLHGVEAAVSAAFFARANPRLHNSEISKQLGLQWRRMTDSDKRPLLMRPRRLRQDHMRAHPGYKYGQGAELAAPPPTPQPLRAARCAAVAAAEMDRRTCFARMTGVACNALYNCYIADSRCGHVGLLLDPAAPPPPPPHRRHSRHSRCHRFAESSIRSMCESLEKLLNVDLRSARTACEGFSIARASPGSTARDSAGRRSGWRSAVCVVKAHARPEQALQAWSPRRTQQAAYATERTKHS
uniref:Sex-determining region Y protein n=1 Tax=Macrostomum lignano TaxID=282301 RepID=A0A1I8JQ74_9PLAT